MALPPVRAAGPRSVTASGASLKWDASAPIQYALALKGDAGKMKHADVAALVDKAIQAWTGVDTAKISFSKQPEIATDVTGANLSDFLNNLDPAITPVIIDLDGTITLGTLGPANGRSTVAFGGFLGTSADGKFINQGYVVINARAMDGMFDPDYPAPAELQRYIERAVGQMLGLASSDANDELRFDGNVANNSAVPIMHPGSVIGGGTALTTDDKMSLSTLYPSATFTANTGVIRGSVLLPDGVTGVQGIDVIARKVDDPVNTVVSAVSGVGFRTRSGRGASDPALRGAYEIHVPAGNYTLEFRPLRANIGPLGGPFPLPGGRQFYQAAAPTAGPADPSTATPVTVTAGKDTKIDLVAAGKGAAAPQQVAQIKPNNAAWNAQPVPLSATVTGTVSPKDPGQVVLAFGGGVRDKIENLYRITVTERSIVTLFLQPATAADLDLYVLGGILGHTVPDNSVNANVKDTRGEAMQLIAPPGTYTIGVSAWDNVSGAAATASTDYTLSITTTPLGNQPAATAPVLDQMVLGNVTDTGADVSWTTDLDATGDAIVAMPQQQFGDTTLGKLHHVTVGGLNPGSDGDVTAISQVADGTTRATLPRVYFRTANSAAASGPTQLNAAVVGLVDDSAAVDNSVLVAVAMQNSGGAAANVQITGLTPSSGWKLAQPLNGPLSVGGIGSGGTALVVLRLIRDGNSTGPAPLATVTGTGTLTGADGAAANFTISGP